MSNENRKIRVLYFVDRLLKGGIQTLFWNIACEIDTDRFGVEFITLDDGKTYLMEEDLRARGFVVHKLDGIWLDTPGAFTAYKKALCEFFAQNGPYDIAHMHSTSKNYLFLEEAEWSAVTVRNSHSHSTGYMTQSRAKALIGDAMKGAPQKVLDASRRMQHGRGLLDVRPQLRQGRE